MGRNAHQESVDESGHRLVGTVGPCSIGGNVHANGDDSDAVHDAGRRINFSTRAGCQLRTANRCASPPEREVRKAGSAAPRRAEEATTPSSARYRGQLQAHAAPSGVIAAISCRLGLLPDPARSDSAG